MPCNDSVSSIAHVTAYAEGSLPVLASPSVVAALAGHAHRARHGVYRVLADVVCVARSCAHSEYIPGCNLWQRPKR